MKKIIQKNKIKFNKSLIIFLILFLLVLIAIWILFYFNLRPIDLPAMPLTPPESILSFFSWGSNMAGDYDGDGKADLAVYDLKNFKWYIYSVAKKKNLVWDKAWGFEGAIPVSGDYDGDGKADLAVYSVNSTGQGNWWITSMNGKAIAGPASWGYGGSVAVSGDYDGDGKSDLAVYDPVNFKWFIYSLAKKQAIVLDYAYGLKGSIPVSGDYDGDGKSDLAVYDLKNFKWYIYSVAKKKNLVWDKAWGFEGAIPVSGNYDGDNRSDLAVYFVNSTGQGNWWITNMNGKAIAGPASWGFEGAIPVSGDYDGDGKSDLAVYDLKTFKWFIYSLAKKQAIVLDYAYGTSESATVSSSCCSLGTCYSKKNKLSDKIGFLIVDKNYIDFAAEVGAGWIRPHPGPFVWDSFEPLKGKFNFSYSDEWVREAQKNGVSILATLWPYASWDQAKCRDFNCKVSNQDNFFPYVKGFPGKIVGLPQSRCSPCSYDDYKFALLKLVERYDGDGMEDMPCLEKPIKFWEILNEPEYGLVFNSKDSFFYKGTASEYFDILKVSSEIIKSTCSDCFVVLGGAVNGNDSILFWKKVMALGGDKYFDISNVHWVSSEDNSMNVLPYSKFLIENNLKKPLWVTEVETQKENSLESAANNAFQNGASKIFLTQFAYSGPIGPNDFNKRSSINDLLIKRYN